MQAIDNCVWFDIWKKTWKQWQRGVTRLCILRHLSLNKRIFEVQYFTFVTEAFNVHDTSLSDKNGKLVIVTIVYRS